MIVVDTSALMAIALAEKEAATYTQILATEAFAIGWPTVLETRAVLLARGAKSAQGYLQDLLALATANPIVFGAAHFLWAELALEKFGKGRGHPAQLNYGDCMSYAVARELDAPLLFKGADFFQTDVVPHRASVRE